MERLMRETVDVLRIRGVACTCSTMDAVVDGPLDDHGKLPANPDTGAGTEPGTFQIEVGDSVFTEAFFASISPQTAEAFADAVQAMIGGGE